MAEEPVPTVDDGDPDPKARGPQEKPHFGADQTRGGNGGDPALRPSTAVWVEFGIGEKRALALGARGGIGQEFDSTVAL